MAVPCLPLGLFTPNVEILWISVSSFRLCGSIAANPIIYRLVPSPSRYEIRRKEQALRTGIENTFLVQQIRNCWKAYKMSISSPELRSPWPAVGKRELWEHPFWNNNGNNRILHIRFHCAESCIYGSMVSMAHAWNGCSQSFFPFRPQVKGNEALGTRLPRCRIETNQSTNGKVRWPRFTTPHFW